ncbi:putative phage abortive infection protein [Shewanella colwelliana]|uniref:putative phage abortive infection protein n=1 Tax=Shewanella colwelliana TaxID=23 RepID=UPI0022B03876|nr:putative phage abortive infection protein [Shewanella colwelliana]MCZ4339632.1 hypothetical protein [Shewanella colwelliana]
MKKTKSKSKHGYALYIIGAIAIIIALCTLTFYWSHFSGEVSSKHNVWAEFGDFIGGVLNPVFGFLGLIAILITVSLQANELSLTRDELERSSEALESQNNTFLKQSFENSFFQMLNLHNTVLNSMEVDGRYENEEYKGRECFEMFMFAIRNGIVEAKPPYVAEDTIENQVEKGYAVGYSKYPQYLGHYFRLIFNMLSFVDNADNRGVDKLFYVDLFESQVSENELLVLFYYCLTNHGRSNLAPLAKKYRLFKSLRKELIGDDSLIELWDCYEGELLEN